MGGMPGRDEGSDYAAANMSERAADSGADKSLRGQSDPLPSVKQAVDRLGRLWLILILVACVPVASWWVMRVVDAPANGWFQGQTTFAVGSDFSVFYTAGALVREGESETLYDVESFRIENAERTGWVLFQESPMFGNSPAFAVAVAPLTRMSWEAAWVVWTVLSLAALAVALAGLGLRYVLFSIVFVLLTMPGYSAIIEGQSTMFWLLIIAAIFVLLKRGSSTAAGVVAGLLILKPPLLIGFGLWWLIDRRMHRTLLVAASSAVGIILLSVPFVGRAWLEYPMAVVRFGDLHREAPGQQAQYSPWGFVDLLVPGYPGIATAVGVVASIIGVAAFVVFFRRHRDEWRLLFAAAIIATLWISPHILRYDWVLLVAPLAVIWHTRSYMWEAWLKASIVLAVVALWSASITNLTIDSFGWAFQFAVPAFAAVAWYLAHELRATEPGEPARSS